MTRNAKIGEFLKESRIPGSTGSTAKKITVKLYGKGVFAKQENRPGSENTSYYKRKAGQFIYSKLDFLNGAFGIIPEALDGYESTVDLPCFDFISSEVSPEWFLQFVSRSDFYSYQGGLGNGGRKARRISPDDFLDLEIEIPPLPEQKKIAEILSGIDRQIGLISRAIDSNRAARNALMESIFHEGHRKATNRSDEWRIWTVEELLANSATPMRSGPFGSALLKEELADEGIPFLGIDNVKTEEFVPTFKRFLPPQKFQQLSRYEVFPHDVMITIMGTVGRSCVVPAGIGPCVSSKHTWTMTFDRHKVAPEIVCWQLNHFSRTRKRFSEGSQGGVMDAISSQTLRETEVPFPTAQDLAERILGYYKISLRHEKEMRARLEKTRLLKSAVSSDLLSGRKRVSV